MILDTIIAVSYFVAVVFVHEGGHLWAMSWFGQKGKIHWRWFGFEAGTGKDTMRRTPFESVIVFSAGPIVGAIPVLMVFGGYTPAWILYAVICIGDALGILGFVLNIRGKDWFQPYHVVVKRWLDEATNE